MPAINSDSSIEFANYFLEIGVKRELKAVIIRRNYKIVHSLFLFLRLEESATDSNLISFMDTPLLF